MHLVANTAPELTALRAASMASEKGVALAPSEEHKVAGTEAGKASSADVVLSFSGFLASAPSVTVFDACVPGSAAAAGGVTLRNQAGHFTCRGSFRSCAQIQKTNQKRQAVFQPGLGVIWGVISQKE